MAPELLALVEAGRALAVEDRFELAHQMLINQMLQRLDLVHGT